MSRVFIQLEQISVFNTKGIFPGMQTHSSWKEIGEGEESLCSQKKSRCYFPQRCWKDSFFFVFPFTGFSDLQWTVFASETQAAIPQAVLGKTLTDVRFTQWVGFTYIFLKSGILGGISQWQKWHKKLSQPIEIWRAHRVKSIVFRDRFNSCFVNLFKIQGTIPTSYEEGKEPRVNSFGPFKDNMIHICVQPLSWVVHSPPPESMSPSQSPAGGGRWTR